VQQVHVNALILDCGMDFDGNGDKTEGKNPVADRPRHRKRLTGEKAVGYGGLSQRRSGAAISPLGRKARKVNLNVALDDLSPASKFFHNGLVTELIGLMKQTFPNNRV
jgi:hypothetical protein